MHKRWNLTCCYTIEARRRVLLPHLNRSSSWMRTLPLTSLTGTTKKLVSSFIIWYNNNALVFSIHPRFRSNHWCYDHITEQVVKRARLSIHDQNVIFRKSLSECGSSFIESILSIISVANTIIKNLLKSLRGME